MRHILYIITSLGCIYFSCQKEITVVQPHYQSKFSIQGFLEPDSLPKVYFNRTTPFLSSPLFSHDLVIRNADVRIISPARTDVLKLDSTFDYIYCTYEYFYLGSFKTDWNKEYQLEIRSNNELYQARANTSLVKVNIEEISYTESFNDVYGEHEGVIVLFKDIPSVSNYYRYEQIRPLDTTMEHASISLSISNKCIGSNTITILEQGRSVYSDENIDGETLKLVIEPAFTHRENLKTIVKVQTIDKNMYEFYRQIDEQKLAQYNPFVEPVFLREGQFGKKAIGFFGSRTRSEGMEFIFPE